MEKATVYYTDFRVHAGTNLQEKLEKLIKAAGIGQIDMDGGESPEPAIAKVGRMTY